VHPGHCSILAPARPYRSLGKNKRGIIDLLKQRIEGKYIRTKTDMGIKLDNKYRFRPVIEFENQNKQRVRFTTSIAQSPHPFQIGKMVTVFYEPDKPKKAQVYDFVHLWFSTLILIGFGLFFVTMGLVGFVANSGK
jgi:hypothetical protein